MQSITDLKTFLDNTGMLEWWNEEDRKKAHEWIWQNFHQDQVESSEFFEDEEAYIWNQLVPAFIIEVLEEDPYDYGFEKPISKTSFTIEGVDYREKTVVAQGTSGRIYLPASWIGRRVKVILLE